MLYVTFYLTEDEEDGVGWHVQDKRLWEVVRNSSCFKPMGVMGITSVRADGDELALILSKIHSLPTVDNVQVMEWFGDHARFIVRHL